MSLNAAFATWVALVVPDAIRREALRFAGDAALRAELATGLDSVRRLAAEQRARAVRAEEERDRLRAELDGAWQERGWARTDAAAMRAARDVAARERDAARAEAERLSVELRRSRP